MSFKTRSYQLEMLDAEGIPFDAIRQNMQELDRINTLLGGHRITCKGFAELIGNKKYIHVCEIGCGGGDNLLALLRYCHQRNIQVTFTGIDIKQACIDFALTRKTLQTCTNWMVSDYKKVTFTTKPDIIFSSLFCHHFTNEQLQEQLRWMKDNSNIGFFINDLHRHVVAYYAIKILTRIFSKNYLVKNDAPLSVARAFTRNDWVKLFSQAGIQQFTIRWQWAFRHLITYNADL